MERRDVHTATTKKKVSRVYIWQLLTIFSGFIVFGLSENIKGPAIPRIQFDLQLDEAQIGTLLSLNSLGYLLACMFTGLLVKKWGIKAVSTIAFSSMFISGFLIWLSSTYSALIGSTFLLYIANGMLEIGLAVLGARIFVKNAATMMNLSHFFYGASSVVAPLLATGLMSITLFGYTISWGLMYAIVLTLSIIPILPTLFSTFPGDDIKQEERSSWKQLLKDRTMWMIVFILTSGVVSELAVGGWLVNYLEKSYSWSSVAASSMLSTFFIAFSLARLLLGPIIDRIGLTVSIAAAAFISGICTFLAIFGGESLAICFALSGAGIAIIYPTIMALIAKRFPKDSDVVISFVVTMVGFGSVIGNFIIGWISKLVKSMYLRHTVESEATIRGLQAGYSFIGLCALICGILSVWLYIQLKRKNELI